MGGDKTKSLRQHARQRALQRHGALLTDEALQNLIQQIHSGDSEFIERQSINRTVHAVIHEGAPLHVIYDRKRKTIITVLP